MPQADSVVNGITIQAIKDEAYEWKEAFAEDLLEHYM